MGTVKGRLEVNGVSKSFRDSTYTSTVLADLTLHADAGEFVSIVGPSGCGKSTLFHMIGGILAPDAGRIVLDGRDITGERGHISYMPQANTLLPWRTVLDNVVLGIEVAGGMDKRKARELAGKWLGRVGLADYAGAYPHVLSGGMQQRVAFIRALISPQSVLCLDEPFGALDALTREDMQRWLLRIWEENRRTVLFVTHSIEEALYLSDRIYVLGDKPTRVAEEIRVPFPRPRADGLYGDAAFVALRKRIYDLMRKDG
jgi:ABC-type nitrate/sulfonate/bicarbonate transport system ATPase subunit